MIDIPLRYGTDRHWCDSSGIYLEGWLHHVDSPIDILRVIAGEQTCEIKSFLMRPGLAACVGDPPNEASGFCVYLPRRASNTLHYEVVVGDQTWRFPVELPTGSILSAPWSHAEEAAIQSGVAGSQELNFAYRYMVDEANAKGFDVAEVGSRNVAPGTVSKRELFPRASRYIGVDVHAAPNVDVVGDAHFLHELLGEGSVDLVFSTAVMEHLAYPWLFSAAVNRTLRPGGLTFHLTHQAWPIHEEPNDFWRFSDSALRVLFGPEMGFEILRAGMHNRACMYAEQRSAAYAKLPFAPCYTHAFILARKVRGIDVNAVRWPVAVEDARAQAERYPMPSGRGVIRPPEVSVRPVDDQLLSGEDAVSQMLTDSATIAKFVKRRRGKIPRSRFLGAGYAVSAFSEAAAKSLNVSTSINQATYLGWIEKYDTITQNDIREMNALLSELKMTPLFSVIMPVYNTNTSFLRQTIDSVLAQTYPYFEICIADDASSDPEIRAVIQNAARRDQRIKYIFRSANGHISECSNSAFSLATGDFVVLVDHDDVIPMHSLWTVAFYINMYPDCQVLFSDEDKIDYDGVRQGPYFKGAFDEYLLYGHNMVSHLGVYRRSLVEEVGRFRRGYEGSQDYDLILRCFDRCGAKAIVHIPHVLYHCRMTAGSESVSADQKGYAILAAQKSIDDHFARGGLPFRSVEGRFPGITAITMAKSVAQEVGSRVSVIIPTRDGGSHLAACIDSIKKHKCPNVELIIVDNGSHDEQTIDYLRQLARSGNTNVLSYDMEFNFSKINNFAVDHASGSVLCFLNDDTEVVSSWWLSRARTLLSIPTIGIVGARLLYPDMTLQHFGIHLGLGPHKVAGTPYVGQHTSNPGLASKAILMQQFCAVTGACLFIRREDFMKVGGFEPELAVAYNDVDLGLRVRETGLQVVCDPDIELIHHESKSRGSDITPEKRQRLDREGEWMRLKWEKTLDADPFFNPNFDKGSDYALAFPPRVTYPWRTAPRQENSTSRQAT